MPKKQAADYKTLNRRLDEILLAMQANETEVDDALKYYKEASVIIRQLEQYLDSAENKIVKL